MPTTKQIINYTNELLNINKFPDYCPNGLQVEGKSELKTIVTGVTACQALIDAAIDLNADLLLVHHGYFWKNEIPQVVGMKRARLAKLLKQDMNLAAYHLPLDAHGDLGNNVKLAEVLNIDVIKSLTVEDIPDLFYIGKPLNPVNAKDFAELINKQLGRQPLFEEVNNKPIETIAWCTGGAQDLIVEAVNAKCDAYLTGEVSERTIHIARENNINFFAAGHHATERYGIKALGEHLAKEFGLAHHFIDIDNPA